MSNLPFLLLKNGGSDRNVCSLNSNIQMFRHIPEFVELIHGLERESAIFGVLSSIFHNCGSNLSISASLLRQLLAKAVQRPLDSGAQYDAVELLSYLLNVCPAELFTFRTSTQYRFHVNDKATFCPTCKQLPAPVTASDRILKVAMPFTSTPVSLQNLVQKHFSPSRQTDGRKCSNCLQNDPNAPLLPSYEKINFSTYPSYLFIQILRMRYCDGKTIKCSNPVNISSEITVDKQKYEVVGSVSHMGTADAGHNRAYLRHGMSWYLCEDDKPPRTKLPIDDEYEQNYFLLLRKKASNDDLLKKKCIVVVEKLPKQYPKPNTEPELLVDREREVQSTEVPCSSENKSPHLDTPKQQQSTKCKVCGKSFLRLNLHITKSKECSSKYDMQSIKKEMEDAKRQKSMERMREFRKRKNEQSDENVSTHRQEEAEGRQSRRMREKGKDELGYQERASSLKQAWRMKACERDSGGYVEKKNVQQ